MYPLYFTCILVIVGTWGVLGSLPTAAGNSSAASIVENSSDHTNSTYTFPFGAEMSTILRDLPTLKNIVFIVCGFTAFLITCLVVKVFRSGRKIRKTRKYDIITTPAERVEMAPLNGDNNDDDDDDSTLFDVKYRWRRLRDPNWAAPAKSLHCCVLAQDKGLEFSAYYPQHYTAVKTYPNAVSVLKKKHNWHEIWGYSLQTRSSIKYCPTGPLH